MGNKAVFVIEGTTGPTIFIDGYEKGHYYSVSGGVKTYYNDDGSIYVPPFSGLKFTSNMAGSRISILSSGSPDWTGYYSLDNGSTWISYIPNTTGNIILPNIGDTICFKGQYNASLTYGNYVYYVMDGRFSASGNIMSFCSGDNFENVTSIPTQYCFTNLFKSCSSLTSTPELPATTLMNNCYYAMFSGCTGLTTTPTLPATSIPRYGYGYMFNGCSNLTSISPLPITTFSNSYSCYRMFHNCTSLKVNNDGSSGTLFFTCPNIVPSYSVTDMFSGTGGTYTSDPVANGTYYYY